MNDITFIIPTFNTVISELERALQSALEVRESQIIIVDDASEDKSLLNFLRELSNDRIKVFFNKKNLGAFWNSIYSYTLAETKFVKKLDPDDFIQSKSYNEILLDESSDIIFTGYKYKKKRMNRKIEKGNGHLFNGSTIYKTSIVKNACDTLFSKDVKINNWFEDQALTYLVLNTGCKISLNNNIFYNYMDLSMTKPKSIRKKYDLWVKDFIALLQLIEIDKEEKQLNRKFISKGIEKQLDFEEILSISLKRKSAIDKELRSRYRRTTFTSLPHFMKRLISSIVVKF